MICVVCGKKDCENSHKRGNELPDDLFHAIWGEKRNYAAELSRLNSVELPTRKSRMAFGIKLYHCAMGTKAKFQDKSFAVSFIDPRLFSANVAFYERGCKIEATQPERTEKQAKKKQPPSQCSSVGEERDDCIQVEAEEASESDRYRVVRHGGVVTQSSRRDGMIAYCRQRMANGASQAEIVEDLRERLEEEFLAGSEDSHEIALIFDYYQRHFILPDTAMLLFLSYFAQKDDTPIPLMFSNNNQVTFSHRDRKELFLYMRAGAYNYYPNTCLREQVYNLLKPIRGERRLIHIIAWNIFRVAAADADFNTEMRVIIEACQR